MLQYTLVLFSLFLISSCSNKALSLLFDIPVNEEAQETTAEKASQEQSPSDAGAQTGALLSGDREGLERPAIEETLDWFFEELGTPTSMSK